MGQGLARRVVDIHLEQRHRLTGRPPDGRRRGHRLAEHDLYDVGPTVDVARTRPIADGVRRHGRQRSEPCRQRGQEGGSGRRRELVGDVDAVGGDARIGEEGHDGGRRVREQAVGAPHGAGADGDGRGADLVDVEALEGGAGADDVDDGVERPDLMELDVVGSHAVDATLDHRQSLEDGDGPLVYAAREVGAGEHLEHLAIATVAVLGLMRHDHAGGTDAAPLRRLDRDAVGMRDARNDVEHGGAVGAGVEQRRQRHVAGDPREAVEPGRGHARVARWSQMRATAHAAPKPLSMPTTVIPAAHDASMARRAVTPPKLAP
jgi:hypothetical protein